MVAERHDSFKWELCAARWKQTGTAISLASAYCAGVPAAFVLCLCTELGIKGLWLGMGCGQGVALCLHGYFLLCRMRWQQAADETRLRAQESSKS